MESKKGQKSAGLLMYEKYGTTYKYLLIHPTGGEKLIPKQIWGIPKGLVEAGEEELSTAIREFTEESGIEPKEPYINLGTVKQKSGKVVQAWAFEGVYPGAVKCSSFVTITRGGKEFVVPEVDKGGMFTKEELKDIIIPAHYELIERFEQYLKIKENAK
jgi:predicted NUDIX family NTP pyrophosphohydrolase